MIRLLPIIEQLKAAGYPNTEGLMEFAGLTGAPRVPVALFVVPDTERAQPNRMSGVTDQKVEHAVTIVLVLKAEARRPGDVSDALADHAKGICDAMLGWKHPDASGRWEYVAGRLGSVDGPSISWFMSFRASYHLRSKPQ